MTKDIDFSKLRAYKGSVLREFKGPETYRSYIASCKKLVKVWLRIHESQIFFPELITSIKDAAGALRYIGLSQYQAKVPDNMISYLEEITTANTQRWLEFKLALNLQNTEVIVEESREHVNGTHCAFCKIELHYPAFVVHRSESEVLHKSSPIGIRCLRAQQGKLQKLLNSDQMSRALSEIKEAVTR